MNARHVWRRGLVTGSVLCLALVLGPANAMAVGRTVRASVDTSGGDPNIDSFSPSISGNGRFVAFESYASDLVPGDGNGVIDVFVRDVVARTTARASVDTNGGDGNDWSWSASISANGRFVAFQSLATDLVSNDGNGTYDVFVRDIAAGVTTRVSVDTAGGDANGASTSPSISADGRLVAFQSSASDLIAGDGGGKTDIFVRDLVAGTTARASVDVLGGDPESHSYSPSISANGRFVAFESDANDLVDVFDGNLSRDIYVRDLGGGITIRASVDTLGGDSDNDSFNASIDGAGRSVAFESWATDLVAGDGNNTSDIFVRSLVGGTTTRASVDTLGGDPDNHSQNASISADGRRVAFDSYASDLIEEDMNAFDVFVRDLTFGSTTRVAVDMSGGDPNHNCTYPSISGNGQLVAFASYASDLVPNDGNGAQDIFVTLTHA
jgi:Tol biopolymer transport system component